MIPMEMNKRYKSIETLVENHVASRVHAKDATLYDFSEEARACAGDFMGWADLASNPPCPIEEIEALAKRFRDAGIETAVLIGQGGSTQASMTMTKYNKLEATGMRFRTLDSDSPVRVRELLSEIDPCKTLVIVSSKSGGTLEMRSYLVALRQAFREFMSEEDFRSRLVAITDPGSPLATRAQEEHWGGLLFGEPTVGGRFSALSVFGLFPAALVGIDLDVLVGRGLEAEKLCSQDSADNPAIQLAAFMYDNYLEGRDKLSYITPKRGRVLGLWIEQLVAESVGKQGLGILPQVETDPLLLAKDPGDRAAVFYRTQATTWDEENDFEKAVACVSADIPSVAYRLGPVEDLAEHFVMWEYATAMCGYLMGVCPFDQPDVASAKAKVLEILKAGLPAPDFVEDFAAGAGVGPVEVKLSDCCAQAEDVRSALSALFGSVRPHDYFAMNAFLPFTGEGRREALGHMRSAIGRKLGVMACLEIGPRYLHSTGQLQKGGPDTGVYLVISAGEPKDIALEGEVASSLGQLSKAQAAGDNAILAERGRRCLHLHLPDNTPTTLRSLALVVDDVLDDLAQAE